ncbi:MAG: HD domain-containing protein [Bacteroidota bacterium]
MDLNGAKEYILQLLKAELNPALYYHNIEHTLDVYQAVCQLNDMEGINGDAKLFVETAALFHDAGMIVQYDNHEVASVSIAKDILPRFGYSDYALNEIARLIMVTKLPQHPTDIYGKILCDADLDYLGREDFFIHAFKLRVEWQVNDIKKTTLKEWFEIQIQFLSAHAYFTPSSISLRNEQKHRNLVEIRHFLNHQ